MNISEYWVGQIPAKPLAINVYDSNGNPANLFGYSTVTVRLLDSDNEEVDTTGAVLNTAGLTTGRIVLDWPNDRSLFTKRGEMVLQLELRDSNGAIDYTSSHTIRVRELGRV